MPRTSTVSKLSRITEDQWGLVTRRQAEGVGVSPATLQRLSTAGTLERITRGVYRLAGAPLPDHVSLRAAWLQLAPETAAWERKPLQGIVSHRSAAAVYGLGHLPADIHEFTMPERRQARRADVRVHRRPVADDEWESLRGLPVTRPARIATDLLADREDPEAVAQVIADALRGGNEHAGIVAKKLEPHAARFGLRRGDGVSLLRWLLDLVGDPDTDRWMEDARAPITDVTPRGAHPSAKPGPGR